MYKLMFSGRVVPRTPHASHLEGREGQGQVEALLVEARAVERVHLRAQPCRECEAGRRRGARRRRRRRGWRPLRRRVRRRGQPR
jgi:hypothetical protein